MSEALILAFLFFMGCIVGWGIEVIFRRFKKENVSRKIVLFLIMAIVMTLFEYIAGLIFIKGMHVQLWDYSKEKFNIQGIICLKFSIFWAILGAIYYFLIHPHILNPFL